MAPIVEHPEGCSAWPGTVERAIKLEAYFRRVGIREMVGMGLGKSYQQYGSSHILCWSRRGFNCILVPLVDIESINKVTTH